MKITKVYSVPHCLVLIYLLVLSIPAFAQSFRSFNFDDFEQQEFDIYDDEDDDFENDLFKFKKPEKHNFVTRAHNLLSQFDVENLTGRELKTKKKEATMLLQEMSGWFAIKESDAKKIYRQFVRLFHPDRCGENADSPSAHQKLLKQRAVDVTIGKGFKPETSRRCSELTQLARGILDVIESKKPAH